jgi:hypothetical protein
MFPNKLFQTVILKISKPEEPEALTMALALADKTNADMLLVLILIVTV